MLGLWDEALARAAEAEGLAENEFVRGLLLQVAPIHVYRGDLDAARRLLAASEGVARSENASWPAIYALTEAMLHVAEARPDEAVAAVERALPMRVQVAGSRPCSGSRPSM